MDSENELRNEISGIREWLVRLDTKLDFLTSVKETAEEADKKSNKALEMATQNSNSINGIKKVSMWAIGTAFVFGGVVLTLIFN